MLMKYFTQKPGNQWQINDALKAMVRYRTVNLLESFTDLGKFDIIFCRNVLIYFDEKTKSVVIDKLAAQLNPPGYMFLGGAESIMGLTKKFTLMAEHRGLFTLA